MHETNESIALAEIEDRLRLLQFRLESIGTCLERLTAVAEWWRKNNEESKAYRGESETLTREKEDANAQ